MRPFVRYLVSIGILALLPTGTAIAFTEKEIDTAFKMMDADGDGKISRAEYNYAKVEVFFRNQKSSKAGLTFDDSTVITTLKYEDTRVSRRVFDEADTNHDGTLSGVEIMDALPFEALSPNGKDIELVDLAAFMKKIER